MPALAGADRVINLMISEINQTRPTDCPARWCACYMNSVLERLGFSHIDSNKARDFAQYGEPADVGEIGSIMVQRNHVAIVIGHCDSRNVQIISGNYSRKVSVGCEPITKAIAWRTIVK